MAVTNTELQIPIDDAQNDQDTSIEVMLFAEELVESVFQKLNSDWAYKMGTSKLPEGAATRRFEPCVGDAVFNIISSNLMDIIDSYLNLRRREIIEEVQFREQLCKTVMCYLKSGYNPERFLMISASFIGVANIYFQKGNHAMADEAAVVLAYFLNDFILQGKFNETKDWDCLLKTAKDIRDNFDKIVESKVALPTLTEEI